MAIKTSDVFGLAPNVREATYVDRGDLDAKLARQLDRDQHVALRGQSKCGKSWLRQRVLGNAIVVQCRLGRTMLDVYTDALSQLEIKLTVNESKGTKLVGRVEASGAVGHSIFAKLGWKASAEVGQDTGTSHEAVGHDINDLRFIADILRESGRRLVIEDFHYLAEADRRDCAFDIKTLWDYGVFVVIVGVWNQSNLFFNLNPDLTGRVLEVSIDWVPEDLNEIFDRGAAALNLEFSPELKSRAIVDCFSNAGLLQRLILSTLDEAGIFERAEGEPVLVADVTAYETACMQYAEELNAVYQTFASRVSTGIRKRSDSTGIYAHAMSAILDEPSDDELSKGIPIARIFEVAHAKQPRVQLGNLHQILCRIDALQVDEDGRGLVLTYNQRDRIVSVVDRQLLLYRRYSTVQWPWDEIIAEVDTRDAYGDESAPQDDGDDAAAVATESP